MPGPFEDATVSAGTDRSVVVLALSPFDEDHRYLESLFRRSNWCILRGYNRREALERSRQTRIAVVICECRLPDGTWIDVLRDLEDGVEDPPLLVVTSTHADESLWGEVLNLGAYDVLSKPFDRNEVVRIVSLAWLHWKERSIRRLASKRGLRASA
jgi:DNA-binding response OmpR family regulator